MIKFILRLFHKNKIKLFSVTRQHHGRPLFYHRELIGQKFEWWVAGTMVVWSVEAKLATWQCLPPGLAHKCSMCAIQIGTKYKYPTIENVSHLNHCLSSNYSNLECPNCNVSDLYYLVGEIMKYKHYKRFNNIQTCISESLISLVEGVAGTRISCSTVCYEIILRK